MLRWRAPRPEPGSPGRAEGRPGWRTGGNPAALIRAGASRRSVAEEQWRGGYHDGPLPAVLVAGGSPGPALRLDLWSLSALYLSGCLSAAVARLLLYVCLRLCPTVSSPRPLFKGFSPSPRPSSLSVLWTLGAPRPDPTVSDALGRREGEDMPNPLERGLPRRA